MHAVRCYGDRMTLASTAIPIELDFGSGVIRGHLHVYENHACVTVTSWPATLDVVQARTALFIAVIDGRINVPDSAAEAMDLIGSKPRVA